MINRHLLITVMKLTILGSGTSTGVPEIGCTCPVCTSADLRDNRLRASALLHTDDAAILIDCGPDFRTQMLRAAVYERIDGVLITHEHYDHVGGLDDLRPFCRFSEIPIYSDAYTAAHLRVRMPYCRQGILAGTVLAFARALGEYGATSMIAGYTPGKTATIATTVYQLWRTNDEAGALRWVLVDIVISAVVLLAVNLLEKQQKAGGRA